jgi:hypothetical protein
MSWLNTLSDYLTIRRWILTFLGTSRRQTLNALISLDVYIVSSQSNRAKPANIDRLWVLYCCSAPLLAWAGVSHALPCRHVVASPRRRIIASPHHRIIASSHHRISCRFIVFYLFSDPDPFKALLKLCYEDAEVNRWPHPLPLPLTKVFIEYRESFAGNLSVVGDKVRMRFLWRSSFSVILSSRYTFSIIRICCSSSSSHSLLDQFRNSFIVGFVAVGFTGWNQVAMIVDSMIVWLSLSYLSTTLGDI